MGGKKSELLGGRISCFPFCKYSIKNNDLVFQEGNSASEAVVGEAVVGEPSCQGILFRTGHVFQIYSHFMLVLILMPVKF